jgi:hypothetical protein
MWRGSDREKKMRLLNYPRGFHQVLAFDPAYRIVVATVLPVALLLIFFAALQANGLEYTSTNGAGRSNDIIPESGAYHGAVTDLEGLDAFECRAGKKLSVIKIYQAFWHGRFFDDFANLVDSRGAIEFLSLDPVIDTDPSPTTINESDLNACQVLSGDYDSTIITFATQIKNWGQPLMLSSAGEMNGDWAGWSGAKNFGFDCDQTYTETTDLYGCYGCSDPVVECADGPERYRDMSRHVHDIFVSQGVTNVTWVWVVSHESFPDETVHPWNHFTNYYPGDSYVDVIGVDGYNWGHDGPGGWKTFNQVFSETLTTLRSNTYQTKPVIIGEFASAEGATPAEKANWITDAYNRIESDWPEIRAAIWYDSSVGGDSTFPIASSSESIRAYREAVSAPDFIGDSVCCIYLSLVCKYTP